jgi:hypothetical protein
MLINELAALDCHKNNLEFDQIGLKKLAFNKRFNHPVMLVYHLNTDMLTMHTLTHSKVIKSEVSIENIMLTQTDLTGLNRQQYISPEVTQIPRNRFDELLTSGDITCTTSFKGVDDLNYILSQNIKTDLHKITSEAALTIQHSQPFIERGAFDIQDERLINSPLKISKLPNNKLISIYYTTKTDSFLLTTVKKVEMLLEKAQISQGVNV